MVGTCFSAATLTMASDAGVVDEPMIASTLSSSISLRMFVTARVLSEPSSSTTYSTFCPAISVGISGTEFFCGTPREAAGPVVEMVTPILTCAWAAGTDASNSAVAARSVCRVMPVFSRVRTVCS